MPRYPHSHKTSTRSRILGAAEAIIKDRGPGAATVEAVMRRAGLTVGGFYAYFPSKEALAQQALLEGVRRSFERLTDGLDDALPERFARALIDRYLSQADAASLETACPLTLLLPEVARSDASFRDAFAMQTSAMVATVEHRLPKVEGMAPREVALAMFASLAGGIAFAHAAATLRGRHRIVESTRASLYRWLALDDTTEVTLPDGPRPTGTAVE
ncbi:MAG TPA: TetR/AcrR family transcriptional regulator [Casimicrobiaceae bacterium]|nr:TetR/AcrR family transcriptional regulator [Casimicrobiaceae bacterium]